MTFTPPSSWYSFCVRRAEESSGTEAQVWREMRLWGGGEFHIRHGDARVLTTEEGFAEHVTLPWKLRMFSSPYTFDGGRA